MKAFSSDRLTAENYRDALLALGAQMTPTRRKLLTIHHRCYRHQATMSQLAEAMGWRSYSSANAQYGRLAQLVGNQLGLESTGAYLSALCTFIEPQQPGDHWLIIMRPQVVEALKELGWT